MKLYASCPICAHKLCKGEKGTDTDILCPRCGEFINVKITDIVTLRVINKAERERIAAEMKAVSQKRYEAYISPEYKGKGEL